MKEIENRTLSGWSEIILGLATICLNPECKNKNYHREHEGPLPSCNKCGSKIKYVKRKEHE